MPELVRVYVPLHAHQVRELADTGRLSAPVDGICAPGGSRSEAEEGEDAALQRAARCALDSGDRVLVAAADIDVDVTTRVDGHDRDRRATVATGDAETPGAYVVAVTGDIPLTRVGAMLVGDDVLGSEPALGDHDQIELSWYHATELAHLVSLL